MVTKYGMSERVGTITLLGSNQEEVFLGRDLKHKVEKYSEETAGINR